MRKRYPVNIPEDLYKKLKEMADKEGLTIHAVILNAIKQYVHERNLIKSNLEKELEDIKSRLKELEVAVDELRVKVDINTKRVILLEQSIRKKRRV